MIIIYDDDAVCLQRPVMDEIESDEALRFYQFLNYLDGSSFGTG